MVPEGVQEHLSHELGRFLASFCVHGSVFNSLESIKDRLLLMCCRANDVAYHLPPGGQMGRGDRGRKFPWEDLSSADRTVHQKTSVTCTVTPVVCA